MRIVRNLLSSALALAALAFAAPAHAQMTTFTASSIYAGTQPVTGTVCLTAVNQYGNPIAVTKSGGGYYEQGVAFCGTLTAGAVVGSLQVPDSCTDSAAGHGYSVVITNTATGKVSPPFTITGICGSTFDLDTYVPAFTVPITPGFSLTISGTAPSGSCAAGAIWIDAGIFNYCYEGAWAQLAGGGGGGSGSANYPSTPGLVFNTSTSAARNAVFGDITHLFGGGSCSGYLKSDGTCSLPTLSALAGTLTPTQLPAATTSAQGAVQLPTGATTNVLGSIVTHAATDYYAVGGSIPAGAITGLSSITPAYTGDLATGVLADYKFTDGSGTVLTDSSGLGNNGTFGNGAGSPTWVNSGVAFTGNVGIQLPTAINAARTIVLAMYYNPVSNTPSPSVGASTNIAFSSVLTSQLGNSAGLNISMNTAGGYGQPGNYRGGGITSCTDTVVGYHVLGMTFGTGGSDLDHFYVDGQECTYLVQGASAGAITSGNLYLGASNNTIWTAALEGTVYRMKIYSTELTASDHAVIAKLFNGEMASRGVPTAPVPIRTVSPELDCIGDSITAGAELSTATPYCSGVLPLLLNQPAYVANNWGLNGMGLVQITPSENDRVARRLPSSTGGVHVATVFLGTNDLTLDGESPAQTYGLLKAEVARLKAAQFKVFVGTMLSRAGEDANHDTYDALIRTGILAEGADGLIDFAAYPPIGKDGSYAGSCFADETHPNDACEPHLYAVVANALNYYFGHHATNPTIVTSTTYTMTAADGYVVVQPTAATAITLPDCTGQTGAVYTINNSQSTYAVTLLNGPSLGSGFPAQTINGVDYSTTGTFTVPANSSVSLVDVALPLSTSGCVWQTR